MARRIEDLENRAGAVLACLPILLAIAANANAASITATPLASQVNVGERVSVEIRLQLEPGESASLFEAFLDAAGPGVMSVDPSGFGATWSSTVASPELGDGDAGRVSLSLLASGNRTDHDLVATLSVLGTSTGLVSLSLALDEVVILQRDSGNDLEDIFVNEGPGTLLAQFEVVPEPSAALLIGLGISGLAWRRHVINQPHSS
ncbi:MAG: PEP-CTERM sorting domain-containing protein [bacterium]